MPTTLEQLFAGVNSPGLQIGPSRERTEEAIIKILQAVGGGVNKIGELSDKHVFGPINRHLGEPGLKKIETKQQVLREKNKEFQEDIDEDNALKLFLSSSGTDLFEMLPSTPGEVGMELAEDLLPIAKMIGFLPPAMLSRLTKAVRVGNFSKVAKEIAEESPPVRQLLKLAGGDEEILIPLIEQARTKPHTRVHVGPVKFSGDEIDLRKAGGGSGGDLMGQGLYGTEVSRGVTGVSKGYADSIDFQIAKADPDWPEIVEGSRKKVEKRIFDEQVELGNAELLKSETYYDIRVRQSVTPDDLNQQALADWRAANPDKGAQLSYFNQPPGSIPYITDQTEITPVQAFAMYNALPDVLRGIGLSEKRVSEIVARVHNPTGGKSLHNLSGIISSTDKNPDFFMNMISEELTKDYGNAASKSGRNVLNRLRMDVGYDELEYPSGQVFSRARGHRNYLMTRPETLGTGPLDEALIGRRDMLPENQVVEVIIKEQEVQMVDFERDFDTLRNMEDPLAPRGEYAGRRAVQDAMKQGETMNILRARDEILTWTPTQQVGLEEELMGCLVGRGNMDQAAARELIDAWIEGNISVDLMMREVEMALEEGFQVTYKATSGREVPEEIMDLYSRVAKHKETQEMLAVSLKEARGGIPEKVQLGRAIRGSDTPEPRRVDVSPEFLKTIRNRMGELARSGDDKGAQVLADKLTEAGYPPTQILKRYGDHIERAYEAGAVPAGIVQGGPRPTSPQLSLFEGNVDPIYLELRKNALEIGDQESLSTYMDNVPVKIRNTWARLEAAARGE